MSSILLLALMTLVLAIPGIPASLIAIPAGQATVVTRVAAAFGLGYAVSAGCAFALSAVHAFALGVFLPLWLTACAVLWAWALRRAAPREQLRALAGDIRQNRAALAIGAAVLLVLLAIHLKYLYVLGGPRYVYYLNGVEIANSHGVPLSTLEYGQSWPPATDKIYLDAFTGLLSLFGSSPAVGPGVLLLIATFGAFTGLWAAATELGLHRTGVLLPLLYLGNMVVFNPAVSIAYTDYRAEDFGNAVAFCALAVGIAAIRERGWRPVVAAGVILAAASGTHLIPVVVVVLGLCLAGLAAVLFGTGTGTGTGTGPDTGSGAAESRWKPALRLVSIGAVSSLMGLVIRGFAGGSFGLEGAQNPSGYAHADAGFDPTAYLYGGSQIAAHRALWDTQPGQVVRSMLTGSAHVASWQLWLLLAITAVGAAAAFARPRFRQLGVVGLGMMLGVIAVGLFFALSYHTYIEQTFGIRRLTPYVLIGLLLLAVGVAESLAMLLERSGARVATAAAVALVVILSAWLLPSTSVSRSAGFTGSQRTRLVDWVRTSTPCDARFLINQRTEGTFTALTGRYALLEGMGAFLRTKQLPYVVQLLLKAQKFFHFPMSDAEFLRRYDISYVVVARGYQELGYAAPIGPPNFRQLSASPFLQLVYSTRTILVYKVVGAPTVAVSRLLKGPYLHCITSPVRY